ncbi:partner of Y14 and mago isoform X2 [Andrographis paniculata]|uniref:partner of Y14 and mago isoform X2 n=1 Tax=Andrographis paniculata TaxID=175694 RepID=UPI0021E782A7|nr:partner of Y14 and mago isoform X2 [Andrographis paniculata]
MASSGNGNGSAGDATESAAELGKTLKEGERILAPTRRPDGTLRKPIRIRAGYVPQDEVAIYQSRGAIWKKEMSASHEAPPGYEPDVETKPKSKSAKRNERKKEKRQQAAVEKGKSFEENDMLSAGDSNEWPENVESVSSKIDGLSLSGNDSSVTPPTTSTEGSTPEDQIQVIDKKIRALKKKEFTHSGSIHCSAHNIISV